MTSKAAANELALQFQLVLVPVGHSYDRPGRHDKLTVRDVQAK